MKICVIIPSFNGAKTIGEIVKKVRAQNIEVIVVDDGSYDATSQRAAGAGAITLRNETNSGKGVSLRKGFAYALAQGYDTIIAMDGDGQHRPEDINNFLNAQQDNPGVAMIIGNRMRTPEGMPFLRRVTNSSMSFLISCLCWQWIPDSQNGFRLIKAGILKNITLKSSRFEIESEIILEAAKRGVKIMSIDTKTVYENHSSLIHPLKDTMRFIKFIFPYLKPLSCKFTS